MSDSVTTAVQQALEAELLPELEHLAGRRAAELSTELHGRVRELGERMASAALRGDEEALLLLQGTGKLILDENRVRVEADAQRALERIVATAFRVVFGLLSQVAPPPEST